MTDAGEDTAASAASRRLVRCTECGARYRVPEGRLGIRFRCNRCAGIVDTGSLADQEDHESGSTAVTEPGETAPPTPVGRTAEEVAQAKAKARARARKRAHLRQSERRHREEVRRRQLEEAQNEEIEGYVPDDDPVEDEFQSMVSDLQQEHADTVLSDPSAETPFRHRVDDVRRELETTNERFETGELDRDEYESMVVELRGELAASVRQVEPEGAADETTGDLLGAVTGADLQKELESLIARHEEVSNAAREVVAEEVVPQRLTRSYKKWGRQFSELLVGKGLIGETQMQEAVERSKQERIMLFDLLVSSYGVSDVDIAKCRAEVNEVEFLPFSDDLSRNPSLFDDIPAGEARRRLFCPVRFTLNADGEPVLHLTMCNPRDFIAIEDVELRTGVEVQVSYLSTETDVLAMIQHHLGEEEPPADQAMGDLVAELAEELGIVEDVESVQLREGYTEEDGPIVRLANRIIEEAYRRGASDIHIEATDECVLVRNRVDGLLETNLTVPAHARRALVSRLKIMSGVNITERRVPQDGRISFRQQGGRYNIELRVNTLPTLEENEDVVMRILADSKPLPLEKLGMLPHALAPLTAAAERPYGMILCVGPTGSGKTTTLHSVVAHINQPEKKILTAENPVEIRQRGLRQVQIRPEVGYTFKTALRAFLRQDPDVILVGEMRDLETCTIAVEASLTGHLLLSTLHTNNAPETVTRLTDIGVDPVVLSDSLLCVLAQRLARTLCDDCREPCELSAEEFDEAGLALDERGLPTLLGQTYDDATFYRPVGCDACQGRGFRGRIGLHEILVVNDEMKKLIARGGAVSEIRELSRANGMLELYEDGLIKVMQGATSIPQLRSVCVG